MNPPTAISPLWTASSVGSAALSANSLSPTPVTNSAPGLVLHPPAGLVLHPPGHAFNGSSDGRLDAFGPALDSTTVLSSRPPAVRHGSLEANSTVSAAFAMITRMSASASGSVLSFFRNPSNSIDVSMILLSLWALTVYAVVLITFAGSAGRALGSLERRFLSTMPDTSRPSSRPWPMLLSRHLAPAQAAAALQRRMLAVVWVCAALATAGDVLLLVTLFSLSRNIGAVPFAIFALLLAAGLPLLATLRLSRWLWRGRASIEWQIAVAGERLMRDTKVSNQQSIAAQRSVDIESVLVGRFRSSRLARQPVAEHRTWLARLQPAIINRAAMVVRDHASSSDWHAWSKRWLDLVTSAFITATHDQTLPESDTLTVPDYRTTEQIGLRIASWSVVGLGILGLTLVLLADHPLDLKALWSGWDTAVGRFATVATAAGGVVTLISVGRSGSR